MRLPKRSSGFTLIELLVIIAILGILAVIGVVSFSGLQGSGRDARRKVEIGLLAKSLESSYSSDSNQYNYSQSFMSADFPTPPVDPAVSSWPNYCLSTSTGTSDYITPPVANITVAPGLCPTSWTPITNYLSPTPFPTGTLGWMVCARLESNKTFYCKTSTAPSSSVPPLPTATPTITPTPLPTATPTLVPTATLTPTPLPTSTPTPLPTLTPTPTTAVALCSYFKNNGVMVTSQSCRGYPTTSATYFRNSVPPMSNNTLYVKCADVHTSLTGSTFSSVDCATTAACAFITATSLNFYPDATSTTSTAGFARLVTNACGTNSFSLYTVNLRN